MVLKRRDRDDRGDANERVKSTIDAAADDTDDDDDDTDDDDDAVDVDEANESMTSVAATDAAVLCTNGLTVVTHDSLRRGGGLTFCTASEWTRERVRGHWSDGEEMYHR